MADTKFDAKSFNPEAFGAYIENVPNLKRNELLKSRALKGNTDIASAFSTQTGTLYARLPMYGNLDGEALNYDGTTDIVATSTTTFERGVIVTGRAKAWVEKDFSTDITGGVDFMSNVAKQVSAYWEEIDQDILLAIIKGIFSMTGAENKKFIEDHTYDITTNDGDSALVAADTLNKAVQKACGDNKGAFALAIMHSAVATHLENLQLLKYFTYTDENGMQRDLAMGSWNGRVVLVDDSMPIKEVAKSGEVEAYTTYTTYILGDGAFDYENIGAKTPYEMSRDPYKNGGQDTLISRQRKVFAPYGISYEKKAQVSLSPTNAELANGANWTLVSDGSSKYIDSKAIAIAQIISKG
ncbi:phage coat protein [Metaclostridioides mangenotii]|uniref:phage coat protein n=1 Tax=Metaclostridioides mangenotii TaxID=1540 RepID=UPI0028E208D4|nr:phage coat protein [Clostridioides mangenotii]